MTGSTEPYRQAEERYFKMIEEIEDYSIILLDEQGIIRNWNRGAEKIQGYQRQEILGTHFSVFYLPEDRAGHLPEKLLGEAAKNNKVSIEGWRLRKDGSKFWGGTTITALHNENNELIGFSKVTRDLTEKKLAEDQLKHFAAELQLTNEALRKSEERYHKMVSEVQDYAIILLDVNGNIENWNAGAEKIKGYKADEIVGKNFEVFYEEGDRQIHLPQKLLAIAHDSGRALHEGWRVRKNGTRFWGSIVITALHNEEGQVIGYSKVTRDLTDKKEAEDKLQQYLVELEQQNQELDRFAYAASHDLQEPLRKILTFADMIEQDPGDVELVTRSIRKISTSAERMSALIKSVLQYSRLTKSAGKKEAVDLNVILKGVTGDLELLIQEKQAQIQTDHLPVVKADEQQATQLFTNLIHNAIKYAHKRPEIRITSAIVSSRTVPNWPDHLRHGMYYQIVFSDNGIGFEQQYANQIFSLFQRLHAKHEFSGTGVGLALCKKIMDNHNGFIYAEGRPMEGASFYVYFPKQV
jgi:PAS domain S-box